MFLMFTLHRPDVLPTGDQGIKNAVHARLRPGRGAQAGRDDGDRRAVAPAPHARRACTSGARSTTPLVNEPRLFEVQVALDQPLDVLADPALVAQPEHRGALGRDQVAAEVGVAQPLLLSASGAFSPPSTAMHCRKRAR